MTSSCPERSSLEYRSHFNKMNKSFFFALDFPTPLNVLSSLLQSPSDLWPQDGTLTFPLLLFLPMSFCMPASERGSWKPRGIVGRLCPGAPLVLAFLSSQNRSFSSSLLEAHAAVLVAFQMEEEDKCRVCCSSCPLWLGRLNGALYWKVSDVFHKLLRLSSSVAHAVLMSDFNAAAHQIYDLKGEVCHV